MRRGPLDLRPGRRSWPPSARRPALVALGFGVQAAVGSVVCKNFFMMLALAGLLLAAFPRGTAWLTRWRTRRPRCRRPFSPRKSARRAATARSRSPPRAPSSRACAPSSRTCAGGQADGRREQERPAPISRRRSELLAGDQLVLKTLAREGARAPALCARHSAAALGAIGARRPRAQGLERGARMPFGM